MKADPDVTCDVGEAARGMTDQEVQASEGQIDHAGTDGEGGDAE